MNTGLSYDDVCLIPKFNNIPSRMDALTSTMLTRNHPMSIPIVAANMDTIIGPELAEVLIKNGSTPIFHRFYNDETEKELIAMARKWPHKFFLSCGVGDRAWGQLVRWITQDPDLQPVGVCVDIAHGHSAPVIEMIKRIRSTFPGYEVIAGNVCTPEAVSDLAMAGATAVKIGIGPGSACTTRKVTAFGRAQFSAVLECAKAGDRYDVPVIADGGIKSSREIVLALAAGASSVMIGGLFARAIEAAGKGKFRGQASAAFQKEFYGKVKEGTVPEGIELDINPDNLSFAQNIIDGLVAGLRSGMTYGGAINIAELQRKAEFERITPNYF